MTHRSPRGRRRLLASALFVLLLGGCQGAVTTTHLEDKALEREGEKLRREHQKEMYNKN